MLFEEFFKKKRIDLAALEQAERPLFFEFKEHFEQMGEKSFDHTKKYWFNKLRRRFPIPLEVKTERVHIQNPLAEQTITESLLESGTPPPKIGFVPKFKAAAASKPPEEKLEDKITTAIPPAENEPSKPVFKPRFNAAMVKPNPVEPAEENLEVKQEVIPPTTDEPATKPAFKPRFNAGMVKPKPAEAEIERPTGEEKSKPAEDVPATIKPAYKPKFNMKTLPKKPEEE